VNKLSHAWDSNFSLWQRAQEVLPSLPKMQRLVQYALMAASSYEVTKRYERDEESMIPLIVSGVLMGVALTDQIMHRGHHWERIADAKKLGVLSIMGIGAALLSSDPNPVRLSETNSLSLERAAIERDIFFRRGVQCGEDLYANLRLFTKEECTVCVDPEYSRIFGAREMYQRRWDSNVSELICRSTIPFFDELWPHLTNLTLNQTNGVWPCNPPKKDKSLITEFATREILQYFAWLHAPMSVTLLPVNESCYRVVGQGTRSLHMTTLCIKPFLLDFLNPQATGCVTDAFRQYMIEYASDFSFPPEQ
jgi:hypothetical protein